MVVVAHNGVQQQGSPCGLPVVADVKLQPVKESDKALLSALDAGQMALVNCKRKQRNLVPFKASKKLILLAQQYAAAMAKKGALFHSVSKKELMKSLSSRFVAENIQRGYNTVQMHQETMEESRSSVNRSNLLSDCFTEFGSAVAHGKDGKLYSCQLFRRGDASTAAETCDITPRTNKRKILTDF